MEKEKKRILVEILKEQFKWSANFRHDTNLKNEEEINKVKEFLAEGELYDFIEWDSKNFELDSHFIQGRQHYFISLCEHAEVIFYIELTRDEFLQLI